MTVKSWRRDMRKLAIALAATVAMTSVAHADWNGHRRQHYHQHHGGGDAGVALFGGLVGGMIIGGMINQMNQPRYYNNGPVYYDEPYCQQVVTNKFWNGWRWVYQVQTVCN
jgi:hypothetical protein